MELKYLNTFNTIVEEGSFSAAAEKLNYTQSTITFQIGQLEKELSCQLFEKIGRRMVLTSAGKAFIPYAKQVLDAVVRVSEFHSELSDCSGELRIGVAESFLRYKLPTVLKEIVAKMPKAKLIISSMNCYDIRDGLNDGSLDIGIFYQDIYEKLDRLTLHPLKNYGITMIASPDIAKKIPELSPEEYKLSVPFIINEKRCIFRQIFENYLSENNIDHEHTIELGSIDTIKALVANNVGVSFLPRFTVENELESGELCEIPTDIKHDTLTIALGYRSNTWISPIMQAFIDTVVQYNYK